MRTIKFYQQNKAGIETFALQMSGDNVTEKIANALYELGNKQKTWIKKGVRFSGFALSKPVYFFTEGKIFSAEISASLKLKLKFRQKLSLQDYKDLVNDIIAVIEL